MPCTQTLSGIAKDCGSSMGGVVEIYVANASDVTAKTVTDNKISAITMAASAKFATYALPRSTAYMTSTYNIDPTTGTRYVSTELYMALNKMETTKRTEIEALAHVAAAIIVKDANGLYWYLGFDHPAEASTGTGETGTAMTDRNGYGLTFTDNSAAMPYEVDAAAVEGVIN